MPTTLFWPRILIPLNGGHPKMSPRNTGGGVSPITQTEQVIGNTPGRWKLTLDKIAISTLQHVQAWSAMEGQLAGRANAVLVPLFDQNRAPWPVVNGVPLKRGDVPLSDGATFSDGSEFDSRTIDSVMVGDVSPGAVTATIRMISGIAPYSAHFEANEAVYRVILITDSQSVLLDQSGNPILDQGGNPIIGSAMDYSVKLWPPVRQAIPDGTPLNFADPRMRCRLASDEEMAIDLAYLKYATPTVNFVEDL